MVHALPAADTVRVPQLRRHQLHVCPVDHNCGITTFTFSTLKHCRNVLAATIANAFAEYMIQNMMQLARTCAVYLKPII